MGRLERSKMSEEETHSEKVLEFMKRKEENKKKYYVVFATDENDVRCYRRIGFYEGSNLTEKQVFNRPRVEHLGPRKSRYLNNCTHSTRQIHNNNIYQPTEL